MAQGHAAERLVQPQGLPLGQRPVGTNHVDDAQLLSVDVGQHTEALPELPDPDAEDLAQADVEGLVPCSRNAVQLGQHLLGARRSRTHGLLIRTHAPPGPPPKGSRDLTASAVAGP